MSMIICCQDVLPCGFLSVGDLEPVAFLLAVFLEVSSLLLLSPVGFFLQGCAVLALLFALAVVRFSSAIHRSCLLVVEFSCLVWWGRFSGLR
jgi:hypothetical protein